MRVLEELVKLAGHLAWPAAVVVILVVLKGEIRSIFTALTKRVSDPASDISIGKEGLEIKSRVDAALGRIESLEADQSQSKELLFGAPGGKKGEARAVEPKTDSTIDPELMKLADEYLNISASDWAERVRLKDEAARKMANLVLTRDIPKALLAGQSHEGLIMALVSAIHTKPDREDFARISKIAHKVKRLHVKYRITMALGRIFEQNLATNADVDRALEILELYGVDADKPLRYRISQTKAIIDLAVKRLPAPA
jgi:hypothetical protein